MIQLNDGYVGGYNYEPVVFDSNFNKIKNLYDSCTSDERYVYEMNKTNDDGFIFAGVNTQTNLPYIRKCDDSGNFEWEKTLPFGVWSNSVFSLSDNTYFVSTNGSGGRGYQIDADGEIIWSSTDLGVRGDKIIEINEEVYIFNSSSSPHITKIDLNGNILDTFSLGTFENYEARQDMILHSNGDLVVAGMQNDLFKIVRIDINGNIIFEKLISFDGFISSYAVTRLIESSDGSIIVLINNHQGGSNDWSHKAHGVFKVDINDGTKLLP
jgi:hypothetical protein